MGSRRRGRILAMQALYSWDVSGIELEDLIEFAWLENRRGDDDTLAFARLLVSGTVANIDDVDAAISRHLEHWDISRLAKVDLAILRLSTYSLMYQSDIPQNVTLDEAIDIAKEYGTDESYKFVNGVLDAVRREQSS